jgi:hypothetical protein
MSGRSPDSRIGTRVRVFPSCPPWPETTAGNPLSHQASVGETVTDRHPAVDPIE